MGTPKALMKYVIKTTKELIRERESDYYFVVLY